MSDPEQNIDRVLEALRAAQPSPGLESRILAQLDAERQHSTAPNTLALSLRGLQVPIFATVLGCIAAYCVLTEVHRPDSPRGVRQVAAMTAPNLHQGSGSVNLVPTQGAKQERVHTAAWTGKAGVQKTPTRGAVMQSAMRSSRIRKDIPIRPMPLTRQEQLLLQIAATGKPEYTPLLDTVALARRDAEEQAAFHQFFQSRLPEQETSTHEAHSSGSTAAATGEAVSESHSTGATSTPDR